MQQTKTISEKSLSQIDELFVWEDDIARIRACQQDQSARNALIPLLDNLREGGVCVLSRGAIEDYYPHGTPTSGSKPERALEACRLVVDQPTAEALSEPLEPSREPELIEIFHALMLD